MFSLFSTKNELNAQQKSIYDFKVEALDGSEIDFADFKGKKIMIVNTASKCGLTPQYEALEQLHQQYKDNLIIIGFPANNFYTWLTQKKYNGLKDNSVKWNFQKYLLDEKGELTHVFKPTTKPMDAKIIESL